MPEFLSRNEKKTIESFLKVGEDVVFGVVETDPDRCIGCGMCVGACAAGVLELVGEKKEKKSKMVDELPFCFSCGDCVAICPEDAITLTRFLEFRRAFRYLDRGGPAPPRKF
jgi:formate hydrogenlyase subunit 6/NADH:ubiquinone oxidoreductase subunit I